MCMVVEKFNEINRVLRRALHFTAANGGSSLLITKINNFRNFETDRVENIILSEQRNWVVCEKWH